MKIIITILIFFFLYFHQTPLAQGHIDHIKNQQYLELNIDCTCTADTCIHTLRDCYCSNLAFQKSDSLLCIYYDSLKVKMLAFGGEIHGDSLVQQFDKLQLEWRAFRKEHCTVIWRRYEGCGGCNTRASQYMECLKIMTDDRTQDLVKLLDLYKEEFD